MAFEELAAVAAGQHGAFSRGQARSVGISESELETRLGRAEWIRIHAGVLAIAGSPPTWERSIWAASLSVPHGVVSHESAARLHRMRHVPDAAVVLTVPHSTHRPRSVRIHQSTMLDDQIVSLDGLPVTTIPRTLFDLAGVLRRDRYRRVLDSELARARVGLPELIEVADRLCRSGRRGSARFRSELIARSDGLIVDDSELERRFVALVTGRGIAPFDTQVRHYFRERLIGRVDFSWRAQLLIVELDGRRGHAQLTDFELDRRRDQLAVMNGWTVVRFTWTQVTERPDEVLEVLEVLLSSRPASSREESGH